MNLKRILTIGIAVALTACSSAEKPINDEVPVEIAAAPEQVVDLTYRVRRGDSLSRIAQNTTGNGDNWHEIARYNNIKNPNKLNKNDTVMIPGHLLPVDKSKPSQQVAVASSIDAKPAIVNQKPAPKPDAQLRQANSEWVMVEGSYYPKAIYRKPNYSAGMLTRVLPGTTLKHIKTNKNWIQVETDKGRGYVHRSDARRLTKRELSLKTSTDF